MTYWRDRIQKRFAEVEASMTSLRESINSVVEITEGEAGHYKDECERLRNENKTLKETLAKERPTKADEVKR